ncbi:unnamed protein product [Mytilus coruscus]|uniref:Uncharacterized protein n=1 Tax=Mytilus coruscus TaxID=42192 RepID=A0A6J7ZZU6_MYTCO|nr:unnamed protein product [Mytilus coruscus]
MRGSKTGLEVRIRSKAPHLLDIDGDSCNHAHNARKAFCKPFHGFAEHLMSDIVEDYKWSTDQRQALEEICGSLNIKYTMPQNYVPHKWLSVYDVILDLQRMNTQSKASKIFSEITIPESSNELERCQLNEPEPSFDTEPNDNTDNLNNELETVLEKENVPNPIFSTSSMNSKMISKATRKDINQFSILCGGNNHMWCYKLEYLHWGKGSTMS